MREELETVLNHETATLKEMLQNLENNIDRARYMISSAEAKIQRVDPGSAEFEETVRLIEHTKRSLQSKTYGRLVLDLELKKRAYFTE